MKKTILLFTLVCWGITLKSQNIQNVVYFEGSKKPELFKGATTEEEYNYMAKGYKNHLTDGSDLKKGYTINDNFDKLTFGVYNFKFIPFFRSDKSFVGFIVKAHSGSSNTDYWYGIPYKNPELFKLFVAQVSSLDDLMTNAFINAWANLTQENIIPATTEMEYAYMTVGYKNHLTDGSDLKKGYKIDDNNIKKIKVAGSMANYDFTFIPFMRDNNLCAGIIMKLVSDGSISGGTYYYAIANSILGDSMAKFENTKATQGTRVLHAILQAYLQYTMEDI